MTATATSIRENLERTTGDDVPSVITDHTRGYTVALITREAAFAAAGAILSEFGADAEAGDATVRVAQLDAGDRLRDCGAEYRVVVRWDR